MFGRGPGVEAYVVSHPWRRFEPPALNSLLSELPAAPSTFYIHDLALAPNIRGTGAAFEAVAQLADCARSERLPTMSLIAVNGSAVFWRRQGFETVHVLELMEKLRTYDDNAQFMVRDLG